MATRTALTILTLLGGVTSSQIAANAVTNAALADNAVGNAELADNAVNTAELANGAVTVGKTDGSFGGTTYYTTVKAVRLTNLASFSAAPDTQSGASLAQNDNVGVFGQSSTATNGIYNVDTVGTGSNGSWSRAAEFDNVAELPIGLVVYDQTSQKTYRLSSLIGTLGTDAATFEEVQEGLTPIGANGEPEDAGTGDASNLNFDLSVSGIVYAAVLVEGILQDGSTYAIAAGAGAGGVDRLEFTGGNAPPNNAKIQVIGFYRS